MGTHPRELATWKLFFRIANHLSTKNPSPSFTDFGSLDVLYDSCSRCFFSNSADLLFFSGTGDNPNSSGGPTSYDPRLGKRGEFTGFRGIAVGGDRRRIVWAARAVEAVGSEASDGPVGCGAKQKVCLEEAAGGGGSDGGEPPKMGKTTVRGQLAATGLMKRSGEGGRGGWPEGLTRAADAFWPVDETGRWWR
uniref:Uncharacterized protein n=1 Tax=Oryza barthii TaxID=65489 RepID=A0A0D3G3J5_9ORYZ